jgi:MerR family transcriptional regulator, copper efflux regulator
MTIGELARIGGVSVETLRFYEKKGLISPPTRRPSGYRDYPASAAAELRFIRNGKELGFSLVEIRELMVLRERPAESCDAACSLAIVRLDAMRTQLRELQASERRLARLLEQCQPNLTAADCPIFIALSHGADAVTSKPKRHK